MQAVLGSGGSDVLAGGTLGSMAGQVAGNDFLSQLLPLLAQGGDGGMPGAGPLGPAVGGPRQVPPMGPVVPPSLGLSTFPQLGQQSIMQVLSQLLGLPAGQFK